jgi:tyrosine-protein kinase Etk/Wzc
VAQDCVVEWEIGEEVPFIEVGGPNKKVEVSPALMKHAPQPAQPPHLPVAAVKPAVVDLARAPASSLTVMYEAWPTSPATTSISTDVVAYHQPTSATTAEYARLLDALLAGGHGALTQSRSDRVGGAKVLLAVGVKPRVGASTVLANLAVLAAQSKKLKVAVIDASASTGLASRLGGGPTEGIAGVLAGSLALDQALAQTCIANLNVLPAGKSSAPLAAEAVAWLMAWLRERFDLIVIDGPALDSRDNALIAPQADEVYLVLAKSDAAVAAKNAAQAMTRLGGRVCGLVHTQFE